MANFVKVLKSMQEITTSKRENIHLSKATGEVCKILKLHNAGFVRKRFRKSKIQKIGLT